MFQKLFFLSATIVLFASCAKDAQSDVLDTELLAAVEAAAQGQGLDFFMLPASNDYSKIPQDPKNPLTSEKVELGKLLYHESALATNPIKPQSVGTYSCASCHFAAGGFQACLTQGISEGGMGFGITGEGRVKDPLFPEADLDVQPVRTPSAMNIAYQTNILWNGQFGGTHLNVGTETQWEYGTPKATNQLGFEGTETQAIAGLTVHRMGLNENWATLYQYTDLFHAAFPGVPDDTLFTKVYAGLAIAAYERTLLSNEAPFQDWLKGQHNVMSDKEKRGAIVFFKDANCTTCHTGPALNSMAFYGMGMLDLYHQGAFKSTKASAENLGRGGFTKRPEDMYKFKVPQLYNLKDSPHYGHGASMHTIREVVRYKNQAIPENPNVLASALAAEFVPQHLTDKQVDDLVAFLTFGLRDPDLQRYQPSSIHSGHCIPVNDPMAKADLGCE
ncbi:MAG: cytochrome-c peroxidase [Saprospiraceae bacterium]|nr:cytochrome-c peroxidase [Saprospiraceae bacterium]